MELREILSISGQPGLYKFIAQSRNGIIVESLADGKRTSTSSTAKVSALAEIAIFTEGEDMPLSDVFTAMYKHSGGKEVIGHKSDDKQLRQLLGAVVPEYDRDRVHMSDIKKVIMWYNILVKAGMTEFVIETEEEVETPEAAPVAEVKAAADKPAAKAATKAAAPAKDKAVKAKAEPAEGATKAKVTPKKKASEKK